MYEGRVRRGTKERSFEETYKGHILVINTTTIDNRSDLNRPLVSLPLGRAVAFSNASAGRRGATHSKTSPWRSAEVRVGLATAVVMQMIQLHRKMV